MDRLSDLSGQLPAGLHFDVYHTGFPCGRYYALSATWPDPEAPRSGAVLTHTLLLPWSVITQEPTALASAWATLRKPRRDSAVGTLPSLTWAPTPQPSSPPFQGARAEAAVVLLFGTPTRPIVWVDRERPDDVVRGLWSLLWPAARRDLSFCTLALAPRQLEGRAFGFLGVPPEARGAFTNLARSAAWWDNGQLLDPQLKARTNEAWVQQVLEGGQARLAPLIERSRAALPAPSPAEVPLLLRLEELSLGARARLPAARSRADLLATHFSQLPATHPWWRDALSDLLQRQPDAPLAPRPLWDLNDLIKRPQTRALATEFEFREQLDKVVRRELLHRLTLAPELTCAGLADLVQALSGLPALIERIARVLGEAAATAPSLEITKRIVRVTLPHLNEVGPTIALLRPLTGATRAAIVDEGWAKEAPPDLMARLVAASEPLDDLELAFRATSLQEGCVVGLNVTAHLALRHQGWRRRFLALLEDQEPACVLEWALGVTGPEFGATAAVVGERAARVLTLSLEALAERCDGRAGGVGVFAERARSAKPIELQELAKANPLLGELLLAVVQRGPYLELKLYLAQLLPTLLEQGRLSPQVGARWLAFPGLREALNWTYPNKTYPRWSDRPGPGLLLPLLQAIHEAGPELPLNPLLGLVRLGLLRADRSALEQSVHQLTLLLSRPLEATARALLAGELLGAVKTSTPLRGPELVLLTFPEVYSQVLAGESPFLRAVSWWWDLGWDRAKRWRHWLLDVWVAERWPPLDLLRVIQSTRDADRLFAQIAHRAWRTAEGQALLNQALASLDDAPDLGPQWRGPLEQFVREGPRER